ncbi:EAL domain-containing protein [Paenalcaligenes niemegkensis]|uniref:putative bifunctional diguanylate cyclase/phosphodiesterase n=1 Tax=Paenalcaligenes niemegkensis TaxID=2895469 RepID=UPI001EE8E056|nr:EAL domain-containing protein [Paenalcaligenes niemegkensis]MCQ9617639.1 EAL domain-containing protein [Paenalcaligenes niemegkensis]
MSAWTHTLSSILLGCATLLSGTPVAGKTAEPLTNIICDKQICMDGLTAGYIDIVPGLVQRVAQRADLNLRSDEADVAAAPTTSNHNGWFWGGLILLVSMLVTSLIFVCRLRAKVTHQRRRLVASEKRLNIILDSVDAHIYIKSRDLRYLYANKKMCEFFNISPKEIIGKNDVDIGVHSSTAAEIQHNDRQVIARGERIAVEEHYYGADNKNKSTFFSIKLPLHSEGEQEEALCGISTDITAYKATREANHQLAFFDPLTELPNRRLLLSRLSSVLHTARQYQVIGAVLFIDLDNFKHVNDARGHAVGDALLKRVALRLTRMMREHDTVARIGGDEFVILLTRLGESLEEGSRAALVISERVRLALEQSFFIESQAYLTSVSIGVSFVTADTRSVEDVLREADTAMYRSKEAGRNRVALYHESMKAEVEERLSLERDLAYAIGSEQLEMYIQPQHSRQRDIIGVELLIRWHHPERGLISPERFIPIAEETQLISRLGDWALAEACKLLLRYPHNRFTVSINISPSQFKQYDFLQRVKKIIADFNAPAHRLILEVTEGMLMDDQHHTISLMDDLVKLGVRFAIDDFGTGYSNLAALKRLPLYELKIDRSLVQDIHTDSDSATIVRAVLAMGQQLRLHVVAEGVETNDQAVFLDHHRCSALQGHLFARAMTPGDWQDYLTTHNLL